MTMPSESVSARRLRCENIATAYACSTTNHALLAYLRSRARSSTPGEGLRTHLPNPRRASLPCLRHPHARQFGKTPGAKFITGEIRNPVSGGMRYSSKSSTRSRRARKGERQ